MCSGVLGCGSERKRVIGIAGAIAVAGVMQNCDFIGSQLSAPSQHVAYKIQSLTDWIGEDSGVTTSRSIALRNEQWSEVMTTFANAPDLLLTGGIGGGRYFSADSQILTYVASFGLPVATALLAPVLSCFCNLCSTATSLRERTAQLLLVTLFLVVNRGLDYFSGGVVIALILVEQCRVHKPVSRE